MPEWPRGCITRFATFRRGGSCNYFAFSICRPPVSFFCGLGCAARNICLWQVHILFMAFIPFPEHVQLDMYPSISIRICPPLFLCWTCCPPYPLFPSLSPLPYPLPWFLCFYLFKFYVSLMALGSRRFSLPHACAFNAVLFEILEWSIPCFTSGYRHVFVEEDAP